MLSIIHVGNHDTSAEDRTFGPHPRTPHICPYMSACKTPNIRGIPISEPKPFMRGKFSNEAYPVSPYPDWHLDLHVVYFKNSLQAVLP